MDTQPTLESINQFGRVTYKPEGGHYVLHSMGDSPAVERPSGYRAYYKDGRKHRDAGPAVIWANGTRRYYTDGVLLKIVYPHGAIVYLNKEGKLHRTDGPALITKHGVCYWFVRGRRQKV